MLLTLPAGTSIGLAGARELELLDAATASR